MNKRSLSSMAAMILAAAVTLLSTACPDTPVPAALKDCTVTFETDGGSAVAAVVVKEGMTVTAPAAPIKTGFAFSGWYADAALSDAWCFDVDVVTADTTLYAEWAAVRYSITYNLNDGSNDLSNRSFYTIEDEVTISSPTRLCRVFDGWYESPGFSGIPITSISAGTIGDKTLYAKWTWPVYALRDVGPAGGWIFYVRPDNECDPNAASDDPMGWRYLETQKGPIALVEMPWSNITNTLVGTELGIGLGLANSGAIINQAGHTASAAKYCLELSLENGGQSWNDFFLPSKDELWALYDNLINGANASPAYTSLSLGPVAAHNVISSSESAAAELWRVYASVDADSDPATGGGFNKAKLNWVIIAARRF